MGYIREDQAFISVVVDGTRYPTDKTYSWFSVEGGGLGSEDSKTRPGGMGDEVALGGQASREDVTVATQFTDLTAGWVSELEGKVGFGAVEVGVSYMNPDGSLIQPVMGHTFKGVLKGVTRPDFSTDGSDAGMIEIVVSCHERTV